MDLPQKYIYTEVEIYFNWYISLFLTLHQGRFNVFKRVSFGL